MSPERNQSSAIFFSSSFSSISTAILSPRFLTKMGSNNQTNRQEEATRQEEKSEKIKVEAEDMWPTICLAAGLYDKKSITGKESFLREELIKAVQTTTWSDDQWKKREVVIKRKAIDIIFPKLEEEAAQKLMEFMDDPD
jgi:hypothetical protein